MTPEFAGACELCGYKARRAEIGAHLAVCAPTHHKRSQSGRLVQAANWQPGANDSDANASFPGLTFLQLLFGYKSFDDLEQTFPDCYWKTWQDRVLLTSLFPKRPSDVLPVA